METLLAIGTRKGLWLARSRDRQGWELSGPQFAVSDVKAVGIDTRRASPRLLAGVLDGHFGPTVAISDDFGTSWEEPEQSPVAFPDDTEGALEGVWQFTPGPEHDPDVIYAGTQPSALFRSENGGKSFELVRALWDHPHRKDWFPGGGGQAIHTIVPHPTDRDQVTVAMSTGGVYRTIDGGKSWNPANSGIKADFFPESDQYPEYGQCVHKISMDPTDPDRFYLQNHGGVYRTDNAGKSWHYIASGLPDDFGFPIVAHPHRPGVVYTFPLVSSMERFRFPPDGQCRVFRSEDAGESWMALTNGLPKGQYWSAVMRDAMCVDPAEPAGVYFGSRCGQVYASADEGESWQLIAKDLPDILCLRAAVI